MSSYDGPMERRALATTRIVTLAATCLALNVGLAKVSNLLLLPFTFDTIGTILAAALLRWPMALLVAVLSSVVGSLIIHPAFVYYAGTQVVICFVAIVAMRYGLFERAWKSLLAGLGIGVASAIVSAPVTAIVFGGVAVPSISALNAVFLASGKSLWESVITGSLIVESIDKTVAGIVTYLVLKRLPARVRETPG